MWEKRRWKPSFAESTGKGVRPVECLKCGTCCVAPDIKSLAKPIGERCLHLADDNRCTIYAERPAVCRGYRPCAICGQIAAPTLAERVRNYLNLFEISGSG
jgi:uncharacterized protein